MFSSCPAHLGCLILMLITLHALLASEVQSLPTEVIAASTGRFPITDPASAHHATRAADANVDIAITIHNNLDTNKPLYVYVIGIPANPSDTSFSQAILNTNGFWYALDAHGSEVPVNITTNVAFRIPPAQGSTSTVLLPSYVSSARIYVVEGTQLQWQMVSAADTGATSIVQPVVSMPGTTAHENRWGFVEFTNSDQQFFVDLSYVDFASLGMGISVVEDETGATVTVPGLSATLLHAEAAASSSTSQSNAAISNSISSTTTTTDILESICADLAAQSAQDGNAWDKLCIYSSSNASSLLRILSPEQALQQNIPFANSTYYEPYISRVWSHYAKNNNTLYIDTQNPTLGILNTTLVACTVSPATQELHCTGSTTPMPRPSTADIWGCNSGAFAINATADDIFKAVVPRICAAFTRSTLLVPGGQVQPGPPNSSFYQEPVTNHYARILHEHEGSGGYAFAYDDVGIAGENQEGAIMCSSARSLDVYVG